MLKSWAKKMRVLQPFNGWITDLLRFLTLGQPPKFIKTYLPRSGVVRLKLPEQKHFKLWSAGDEYITNQLFWNGWASNEPETCQIFFELAKQARVTVDVGAHVGYYSLTAAFANPEGQVFGFEPLPMVYERFAANIAINHLQNVIKIPMALGTHRHEAQFYHIADHSGCGLPSSSGLNHDFLLSSGLPLASLTVPVVSLDEFCVEQNIQALDLLKIDTEETEIDVLRGGLKAIAKFRPKIICEVLKSENQDLEEILRQMNYSSYSLEKQGPVPRPKIQSRGEFRNYLFLPN